MGKTIRWAGLLVAPVLFVCAAARAAEPGQQLLDRIRGKALDNTSRVPRYTCVQTIDRIQYRPQYGATPGVAAGAQPTQCSALIEARPKLLSPGLILWHDRLRLDVAVFNGKETFSWAGAGKFETTDIEELAAYGSTGSGDFASFMASVFGLPETRISLVNEFKSPADLSVLFAFTVPAELSHYVYRSHGNGAERVIGYHGSFLVDEAAAELKRLTVEADHFPGDEQMCRVEDVMDYHRVKIGDGDFLLPETSKMTVLFSNGEESQNQTRYSGCREYVGESTIRFEGDDAATATSAPRPGIVSAEKLPSGIRLRIGLKAPIRAATAAAGDSVTGVILRDVRNVARANDVVHGRILRLQQRQFPTPRWIVAIRFDSIEYKSGTRPGGEAPLSLRPLDDGYRARRNAILTGARPAGAGVFIFPGAGDLVLDEKFHSEWATR